jgi:hypothetical protein
MAFDFHAAVTAPFRMQPGLRRLAPGEPHLTPAQSGSRHQREKLAVLSCFASQALLCRPGFDAAPALRAFCAQAATEHPRHWQWDGRCASALGVRLDSHTGSVTRLQAGAFGLGDEIERCLQLLPSEWRLAGLLSLAFEDDLALVDGRDGTLPWMAVVLPSHWAPEEKVGRHFADVHQPVADNRLIVNAAQPLVQLVTAGERWERFVWTITGHARLHAHPERMEAERWPATAEPEAIARWAWWRTERQSFWPVPGGDQAMFTIRVQVTPLAQALSSAEQLKAVRDALHSMSDAVLAYRGLQAVREPLLAWLDGRLTNGPAPVHVPQEGRPGGP